MTKYRNQNLPKKLIIWALIVAIIPTLLAVFQSLHQLTIKDALITACFALVMGIYLSRYRGFSANDK